MAVINNDDANKLYGRMMECCDIEMAIESGQFKTLHDVLKAVKTTAHTLLNELNGCDFFEGNRCGSIEGFDLATAQYEANLVAEKH